MNKICKSCDEEIDERVSFECDDEEIFEAVIELTMDGDICIECALTNAVMDKTMNETEDLRWY